MKSLFFLVLSPLIVFGVSAQRDTNLNREVVPPLKPLDNSTRIVYPSEDTNMNRRPSHGRRPIEDTRICFENELLYPGDNEGDWVCDCKPGYLHFPTRGICYESYTQGPCEDNEIIMLTSSSNIPVCVKNPCENGKVSYNGNCFPLNSDEGCKQFTNYIGRKVLLVSDPSTLQLTCADEDFKYACVENCCIGSKREYRNICNQKRKRISQKNNGKETAV